MFQSLSRDGGGSSASLCKSTVSNSEVQSLSRDGGGSSDNHPLVEKRLPAVSIPQSGWRGFKRLVNIMHSVSSSFNPSVGMAGVQAGMGVDSRLHILGFNPSVGMAGVQADSGYVGPNQVVVSIPQSGWRGFKPIWWGRLIPRLSSFNPSVGMAGVQAAIVLFPHPGEKFQSLSRDGGGSSLGCQGQRVPRSHVSIPQSGWRGFKLWPPLWP